MTDTPEQAEPTRSSKLVGTAMSFAALLIVIAALAYWVQAIRAVAVPEDRTLIITVFLSAVALAIASFFVGTRWFGGFAAIIAIFLGSLVPFTVTVGRQELAPGAIAVGDVIPPFKAPDEHGELFDSGTLHDHILLIKFFRAHW